MSLPQHLILAGYSAAAGVTSLTHVAATYERSITNTSTKTFTVPSSAQAGDLLIAASFLDGDRSINSDSDQLGGAQGEYTNDPLTGWAFLGSNTSFTEYPEGVSWYRVWDGTTSTFTVTWAQLDTSAGVMVAFRPNAPITSLTEKSFQSDDGSSSLSNTINGVTPTAAPGARLYGYFLTGRPSGSSIQNPTPTFSPSTGWTHVDGDPLAPEDYMDYAYKLDEAGDSYVNTTVSTNDQGRQGQHFFVIDVE